MKGNLQIVESRYRMKRILRNLVIIGVAFSFIFLNSCVLSKSDEEIVEDRLRYIKDAIHDKDTTSFENMFASNITTNNNGITAQDIFECFPEGIVYLDERDYSISVTDWVEGSDYVKILDWDKNIIDCATGQEFVIILRECTDNWNEENAVGLQLFLIYNIEDEEAFLSWWHALDESEMPNGIYYFQPS